MVSSEHHLLVGHETDNTFHKSGPLDITYTVGGLQFGNGTTITNQSIATDNGYGIKQINAAQLSVFGATTSVNLNSQIKLQ
jgi:hypothetical protein